MTQSRSRRPTPRISRAIQMAYPSLRGHDRYVNELIDTYRRIRDIGCDCDDCTGIRDEYRHRIWQCIKIRHFKAPEDSLVIPMEDLTLN